MASFTPNPRPVPSLVTGVREPGNTTSQRIIADVQDEILLYMPSAAPLTTLTGMLRKKRETTQYAFDWLEKDEWPRSVELAADATDVATTLTVVAGNGDRVAANFILRNRVTGEQVLVTAVATDTLTVVRGIGSTQTPNPGSAMTAGQNLDFLRAVYPDGAGIGTLKSIKEDRKYNYTEIVRTPFGFTGRQMNTDMYGGKDPMTEKKWHGIEHAKSLELAFFFGKRHTRTPSTIQSFTGGLEYFIETNVWDVNGTAPTERAFVEFLEYGMKYGRGGSNERGGDATKYLFASRRWLTEIEFWGKDNIQYRPVDKRIGLKAGFYDTTHGTIVLVMCPILDGAYADMAFLVDMNHVRYAYHQGRDTKLLDNRQANDIDGESMEYMTDFGAQVELEAAHSILKGLPT